MSKVLKTKQKLTIPPRINKTLFRIPNVYKRIPEPKEIAGFSKYLALVLGLKKERVDIKATRNEIRAEVSPRSQMPQRTTDEMRLLEREMNDWNNLYAQSLILEEKRLIKLRNEKR